MGWGSAIGGAISGVASLIGAGQSQQNAAALNAANYAHQKEFAQNGIRWKVADAKAAGLHPLAALGAQTASYTPSAVVGDSPDFSFLKDMGQGIDRAMDAKSTQRERAAREEKSNLLFNEELRGKQLQNQETETRIQSMKLDMAMQAARNAESAVRTQQQVPPMPSLTDSPVVAGQAQAYPVPGTESKPAEVTTSFPGGFVQAGTNPDVAFDKTRDGGYAVRMSDSQKNANEDYLHGTIGWFGRNMLGPLLLDLPSSAPPRSLLPSGGRDSDEVWTYNPWKNAYYPAKRSDFFGRLSRRFSPF